MTNLFKNMYSPQLFTLLILSACSAPIQNPLKESSHLAAQSSSSPLSQATDQPSPVPSTQTDKPQSPAATPKIEASAANPPLQPATSLPSAISPPNRPGNFKAAAIQSNQLTLVWEAVAGVQGYRIYQNGILLKELLSETSWTITGLSANKEYLFGLEAIMGELASEQLVLKLKTPSAQGSGGGGGGGGSPPSSNSPTLRLNSLSSANGIVGSTLTLLGSGFSSNPSQNIVRFNSVQADVDSATGSELEVEVPQASTGIITVEVNGEISNSLSFNVLPTVSLSSPESHAVLHNQITLSASPSSGNPISKIEFYSGSSKLGEDSSAPYSLSWNTTAVISGAHQLSAKIIDNINNVASSPTVAVTVDQLPLISDLSASINPIIGLSFPSQLSCVAHDTEGTPAIHWSTQGGNFGSFSNSSGPETYWTSPASAGGPYTIRCSADDGVNPVVTRDLSISVESGQGPLNAEGGLF